MGMKEVNRKKICFIELLVFLSETFRFMSIVELLGNYEVYENLNTN